MKTLSINIPDNLAVQINDYVKGRLGGILSEDIDPTAIFAQ